LECALEAEEAFGPVASWRTWRTWDEALALVNRSRYGLQAGMFTNDLKQALRAFQELHVGSLVLNDVPTVRADAQPYGGVKDSGLGREGILSAMDEMTEKKVLLIKDLLPL